MIILHERRLPAGLNPQPSDHQTDVGPTEPLSKSRINIHGPIDARAIEGGLYN